MLFKGLCNVPRIGMHMYILVQTSLGNVVIISSVKTQLIEKHKTSWHIPSIFLVFTCHIPLLSLTRYNS